MRNRNTEGMGWGVRIGIGVAALFVLGAIGLTVYGYRVEPVRHPVEQIVPNDHLPN